VDLQVRARAFAALAAYWFVLVGSEPFVAMQESAGLEANGRAIGVDVSRLVPCVADRNHHCNKDLIVGQFSGRKVRADLNHGGESEPVFPFASEIA